MIRLVLSDVDGTLVRSDKSLSERSVGAVAELHAAGIAFAVTSGRPPRGMAMLVGPLRLSSPIAAFNGGFQTLHGEFGMQVDGRLIREPTRWAATVATLRDGTLAFGA